VCAAASGGLRALGVALLIGISVVGCETPPPASPSPRAEGARERCEAGEAEALAQRHNLQLVFESCGANEFLDLAWSPDGLDLYFLLPGGAHVLRAAERRIELEPLNVPAPGGAWQRGGRLILPLRTGSDTLGPSEPEGAPRGRLALHDRGGGALHVLPLTHGEPTDLQLGLTDQDLLFTALDAEGLRRPYQLNLDTGTEAPALPWRQSPVGRMSVVASAGLVALSDEGGVELFDLSTGQSRLRLPGADRAVLHPGGRYVAVELEGPARSVFDEAAWRGLPPAEREAERARAEAWLQGLRAGEAPQHRDPELQLIDLERGARYRLTAFTGDLFTWYPAAGLFCSFRLWGIEGRSLHPNVALVDLAERLTRAAAGERVAGVEPMPGFEPGPETAPPTDTEPPADPP
jgi:hypothetical protein